MHPPAPLAATSFGWNRAGWQGSLGRVPFDGPTQTPPGAGVPMDSGATMRD